MSLPWGVKYRPRTFKEIVGNDVLIVGITDAVRDGTLSNRLFITGETGSGKTTLSYLFAEHFTGIPYDPNQPSMCITEIDGGSNGGIDVIRDAIAKVSMRPMQGKCHVVIVDESQDLTPSAKKALMKPLETESDVVWMLLTNEPEKLKDVVKGRLNTYKMAYPTVTHLVQLAEDIHKCERFKFTFPEKSITYLAEQIRNVRLFLNTLQDLYNNNVFTNKAVDAAIVKTMEDSELSSLDELVRVLRGDMPTKLLDLMSVYKFWCELLVYAIGQEYNMAGGGVEPTYIRTLFQKKCTSKGAAIDFAEVDRVLALLHRGREMVTVAGCDPAAVFVSLFCKSK
jgi:DNA polymerase III gamma/tau subunit